MSLSEAHREACRLTGQLRAMRESRLVNQAVEIEALLAGADGLTHDALLGVLAVVDDIRQHLPTGAMGKLSQGRIDRLEATLNEALETSMPDFPTSLSHAP